MMRPEFFHCNTGPPVLLIESTAKYQDFMTVKPDWDPEGSPFIFVSRPERVAQKKFRANNFPAKKFSAQNRMAPKIFQAGSLRAGLSFKAKNSVAVFFRAGSVRAGPTDPDYRQNLPHRRKKTPVAGHFSVFAPDRPQDSGAKLFWPHQDLMRKKSGGGSWPVPATPKKGPDLPGKPGFFFQPGTSRIIFFWREQ